MLEGVEPQYPRPCVECANGPRLPDTAPSNTCWTCGTHLRWPLFQRRTSRYAEVNQDQQPSVDRVSEVKRAVVQCDGLSRTVERSR